MPASYVNYHVFSTDAAAVAAAVRGLSQGSAYVTPAGGPWVTVYDEVSERQDAYEIGRLAGELSVRLATAVLAFLVAEGTLFVYYLFEGGDLLDEYNSDPAPPAEAARVDPSVWFTGRPEVLARFCPAGTAVGRLTEPLRRIDTQHETGFASAVRAEERLRPLASTLRIDLGRATTGFYDVDRRRASIPDGASYLRLDGRPLKNPFRGPIPPRLPPR
jgi:hypothetical protein